jgi:CBS domain-containing protein
MRIVDIPEFKDRNQVLTCTADAKLTEAVQKMAKDNYGSILVVDADKKLLGIFTERDLLRKVVGAGVPIGQQTIGEFMTKNVKVANLQDGVAESLRRMSQGRFRHLPVVDESGRPIGMVSQGDFLALTWGELWSRFKSQTMGSFFQAHQIWIILGAIFVYSIMLVLLAKI